MFVTDGLELRKGYLDAAQQQALVEDLRGVVAAAPFQRPLTPWGKPMSVRMTSAGKYGWITGRGGYRYEPCQPDGQPWPAIPERVLAIWRERVSARRPPDCCLVNFYGTGARMGLHQDKDEADFSWPVLSISLGDPATFRFGGGKRTDPTRSFLLESGDVLVMGGPARLAFHGIDRVRSGGSRLLPAGGRINLTCRVVE